MRQGFEWDEAKDRENLRKHGIRFSEAVRIFEGPTLTNEDRRFRYDEPRDISLGMIDGIVVLAVAYTDRASVTRIISARKATRSERRHFHAYLNQTLG